MVFSSIYPMTARRLRGSAKALDKLHLNDAALTYEKDSSTALGFGFRCGFLGLLHLEVVQERLEREYDLDLLLSAPSVRYESDAGRGDEDPVDNPSLSRSDGDRKETAEPFIKASVHDARALHRHRHGAVPRAPRREHDLQLPLPGRVELTSEMPLAEVLFDFYDQLKTVTQGYGSFDYEILDYRETDLVKVDILVNGERVDALSQLVHRDKARPRALHYCERLAEDHPPPAVQDPDPGGDRRHDHRPHDDQRLPQGRHRQMLRRRHHPQAQADREAEGRQEADEDGGSVQIPQEAFIAVLKTDSDQVTAVASSEQKGRPGSTFTSPSARPDLPLLRLRRSGREARARRKRFVDTLLRDRTTPGPSSRPSRRSTPSTSAAARRRCSSPRTSSEISKPMRRFDLPPERPRLDLPRSQPGGRRRSGDLEAWRSIWAPRP